MPTQPLIDLNSLIELHAPTRLTKVATTLGNGEEYAGLCPWCGGVDRFRCWPFSLRPHYWCRGCERSGDAIQFLKDWKNLSFVEACQELGIEPGNTVSRTAPLFFDDQPPCKVWQDFARMLVEKAEHYLWSGKANHALDYLRRRGLTDETIRAAQLGYIPFARDGKWYTCSFAEWGLTDEMLSEKQKAKGNVKVPPGILIPWFADGQLWKLAIKRFEAKEGEQKYGQVVGSKDALYNSDSLARGKPVLLCEGEFDALSVLQEAGDSISPIATGSSQKGRLPLWIARIASYAGSILLSFDLDDAGDEGAAYWQETFGERAMRWPPYSHDINDMLREGKDIRKWIETGLQIANPPARKQPEPFFCSICERDLNAYEGESFIDENEETHRCTPYCDRCWQIKQDISRPVAEWLTCSKCGILTENYHHGTTCYRCWFHSLPAATFPVVTTPQPFSSTWTRTR